MKTKFILPIFTYLDLFSHFRNDSYVYLIEILIAGIVLITVFFLITKNRSRFLNDTYNKSETVFFSFQNKQEEIGAISVSELIKMALENDPLFYSEFIKVFPDFSNKLTIMNSTIKTSDLEFCAMVRLNLDTKQIVQARHVSVKSIESKNKIHKKLHVPTDIDMHIWISKFNNIIEKCVYLYVIFN
ncbi:hypothetical protein J2X97_003758 [Epilithonimonas hungarica]|uniref:hypothetical protein n=1 Tax=Epilithonimonas hungarica TaxID=454006 RepID=UPI002780F50C|nr:hypothetical protein [Epilithonimonas hungarica]MDP9958084.1 hypothetical protein [Epilithonimonas hungarica]